MSRRFYTDAFTQAFLHRQTLLHTDASTRRRFYTQTLLHRDVFTSQRFLRTDAFTHRSCDTQHAEVLYRKNHKPLCGLEYRAQVESISGFLVSPSSVRSSSGAPAPLRLLPASNTTTFLVWWWLFLLFRVSGLHLFRHHFSLDWNEHSIGFTDTVLPLTFCGGVNQDFAALGNETLIFAHFSNTFAGGRPSYIDTSFLRRPSHFSDQDQQSSFWILEDLFQAHHSELLWRFCNHTIDYNLFDKGTYTVFLAFCGGAVSSFHTDILAFCGGALALQSSWIQVFQFGAYTSFFEQAATRPDYLEHCCGIPANWNGQLCLCVLNTDSLLALCGGASQINTGILAFCGGAASFFHTDILAFCGGALAVQASWTQDPAFGSQTSRSDNAETRFDLQEHSGFPVHWLGQYCLHELNTDPLLAFCGGALTVNTGFLAFCGGAPHCARPDHLLGSLDWAASTIQFICVAHNTANSAFGRILQPDCIVQLIHYAHRQVCLPGRSLTFCGGVPTIYTGRRFLACARCCLGSVFSAICILQQTFCGGVFSVYTDLHTQEAALHWEQEFWFQHSIGFDIHNWTAFLRALWTASEWLVFYCTSDFGRLWTWLTGQGLLSDWTCSIPGLPLPVCVTLDPQRVGTAGSCLIICTFIFITSLLCRSFILGCAISVQPRNNREFRTAFFFATQDIRFAFL